MKTQLIRYDQVQKNDKIFTNGKDNHMRRKLGFDEIEIVKDIKSYVSKGNGLLVQVNFESGRATLGFSERNLEKIIED